MNRCRSSAGTCDSPGSCEIEVPVKGEEPAEALETIQESGTETQQTEETAK